jgi:membrane peptidoglycan carboxypeptidase
VISLVLCGLLAGLVVAAAAFPATAVAGLSAKAGADTFEKLPSELQTQPLPLTTTVLNSKGQYVTSLHGDQNRVNVSITQVPKVLQDAVVSIEDSRFYEHHGVDLKGIIRAFVSSGSGSTQGASTITQQYVRQDLALTATSDAARKAALEPTVGRKLREIRYAVALEKKFNKQQILEKYLNTVFFGRSAYGVGVAAQRYFGKTVDKLDLSESALLASYIQSPGYYPSHPKNAEVRRQYVLTRMQQLGYASAKDVADAKAHPPVVKLTALPNSCLPNNSITAANNWGYFCDYLRIWAQQQPSLGNTPEERWNAIQTGGYTIKLSMDPSIQANAQDAVDNRGAGRGAGLTQGIAMIEPGTGRIKALAVNRTFAKGSGEQFDQFPLLTGDPANQSTAGYPSGSTFKMFTMLAALEQGIQLDTGFYSPQTFCIPGRTPEYCPTNANKDGSMNGYRNMWSGFGESVNTYFVQLAMKAKITNVAKAAQKAGITFWGANSIQSILKDGDNPKFARLSLTFGQGSETFPLYMANAYATVAARGMYCAPTPIQSATGPNGKPVDLGSPSCKRVFSQGVADAATDAARCPVGQSAKAGSCGWPTGGSVGSAMDRPVAGKTGSTPGNQQVWFAGFVPQLAGASFSTDSKNPITGASNNGNTNVANNIFSSAMSQAVDNMPVKDFVAPPDSLVSGGSHDHSGEPANPTPSGKPSSGTGRPAGTKPPTGGTHGNTGTGGGGHLPGLPFFINTAGPTASGRRSRPRTGDDGAVV